MDANHHDPLDPLDWYFDLYDESFLEDFDQGFKPEEGKKEGKKEEPEEEEVVNPHEELRKIYRETDTWSSKVPPNELRYLNMLINYVEETARFMMEYPEDAAMDKREKLMQDIRKELLEEKKILGESVTRVLISLAKIDAHTLAEVKKQVKKKKK
jgi:hypothetical protein